MRIDIEILQDNRLVPTVMNINQGQNKLDTALYSMENYVINDVDLSTCDWYAVLMGVYGLDEVKLTHEIDGGVLKIRWDLNNYVTNIGQTLTYQIVAKNSDAAVYYTNKGIILNSQSIHADEFIVANYPSILRQWEEYMKDLSGTSLDAYVVMNLGEYIPVEERVEGKFYINRLTDYDYSCLIEDAKGNVITPSAKGVSYDPTKTKLSANNVQDAIDNLGKKINGLNRFCVNDGNLTDGVEDLLDFSDSTLSFKVGGSYPNVIVTKADGTTFTRGSIDQSYVSDLDDGVYNIFIDETKVELLNNTILSQGQEDLAQPNDVLYNTVTFECKKYKTSGLNTVIKNDTIQAMRTIATDGNIYVLGTFTGEIYSSTDLVNWTKRVDASALQLTGMVYTGTSFICVGQYGNIWRSTNGINWTKVKQGFEGQDNSYLDVTYANGKIVAVGTGGLLSSSVDDGVSWATSSTSYLPTTIRGITFGNNKFVCITEGGRIYTSDDGVTWTIRHTNSNYNFEGITFVNNKLLVCGNKGIVLASNDGESWSTTIIDTTATFNSGSYTNGIYYVGGTAGTLYMSTDLVSWEHVEMPSVQQIYECKDNIVVAAYSLIVLEPASSWVLYEKVPVGSVVVSDGAIIYVETFPYNYTQYNGLIATQTTFGLMRVAAPEDEVDCSCNDASITPSNLYDLSNYRRANTEYNVDDTVGCPYHHNLQLKCAVAGTTSSETLNTKGVLEPKTEIVDGTVTWVVEELGTGGGSGLNVGDIFYTSRLDNELNGAVEANGGVYAVADFTGAQSVPALLAEGKLPFVSMAEYDEIVLANGSCRAFGWDNGDTFRVPTLKDIYLMAGQAESAGEFISESLPNVKGALINNALTSGTDTGGEWYAEAFTQTGALRTESWTSNYAISSNSWSGGQNLKSITFDASLSSSTYQDGAKVRPDSVRYRAMVQLATGATDEALATCTGVLSDVADLKQNKADKDVSVIDIPATSGTVTLADNTIYSGTMTDATTFVLPAVTDATKYHQIKAMLYLPIVTIDWGTTHYIGGEAPDISEAGQYMIYFDYVPALSDWVVGCMKVV